MCCQTPVTIYEDKGFFLKKKYTGLLKVTGNEIDLSAEACVHMRFTLIGLQWESESLFPFYSSIYIPLGYVHLIHGGQGAKLHKILEFHGWKLTLQNSWPVSESH